MNEPTPLYYTFGNHMHWVDMQWMWGYDVLPGSVRDMLRLCDATGARGNVNFDGIGYEKLAAEGPEAFAELRAAVREGRIEVVGASYGQPYGLFHGGESNVRQRIYGVRTVRRLFGVWPRSFWEEEFDFFPQLPQLLRGVGFEYASLFFQWTWHTPEMPREEAPAVWWLGHDGSRLLTAPRGPLNLHQWPEDVAAVLGGELPRRLESPIVLQWLELMPSPDWMCRTELMLPPLQALLARPDLEIRFGTLSEVLEAVRPHAVERRYTLDQTFHGVSLGKNGDALRRLSRTAEAELLAAETLATLAGFFGRPYGSWDVYPSWELEEGWRELLAAQHHDNDECEGLCGHVGRLSYARSRGLAEAVLERSGRKLAERAPGGPGRLLVSNPLGWERDGLVIPPDGGAPLRVPAVPAFGYRVLTAAERTELAFRPAVEVVEDEASFTLRRGALALRVDRSRGVIDALVSAERPQGFLAPDGSLGDLAMTRNGREERFAEAEVTCLDTPLGPRLRIVRRGREGAEVVVTVALAAEIDAVDLHFHADALPRPDGGVAAALHTPLALDLPAARLLHDHPYGVSETRPGGRRYPRKYPSGDWMTSEQTFEEVEGPFTALGLLDLCRDEVGLLLLHDGSQAFTLQEGTVRGLLSMYDPWDEDYFDARLDVRLRFVPHGPLDHRERWRQSQEFERPLRAFLGHGPGGDLPARFSPLEADDGGATLTALYREPEEAGRDHDGYAGDGVGHPLVLRLVEFDGRAAPVSLRLPGPLAGAWKTDLLGRRLQSLEIGAEGDDSRLRLELRPYEIATLYLDPLLARKQTRDLDARRSVWADVHRREERP